MTSQRDDWSLIPFRQDADQCAVGEFARTLHSEFIGDARAGNSGDLGSHHRRSPVAPCAARVEECRPPVAGDQPLGDESPADEQVLRQLLGAPGVPFRAR